jgi:hypothetical protein
MDTTSSLLSLAASIKAPIPLVSLAIVAISYAYGRSIEAKRDELKQLRPGDRAEIVDVLGTKFKINLDKLTQKQKYDLVLRAVEIRAKTARFFGALCAALFVVSLALILLSGYVDSRKSRQPNEKASVPSGSEPPKAESDNPVITGSDRSTKSTKAAISDTDKAIISYKEELVDIRGDIESRNPEIERDLRDRSLRIAQSLSEIHESRLKLSMRIIKHEYSGWGFLMGVSTYDESRPADILPQSRIDYATKAIAEFDKALDLMADIAYRYSHTSDPESVAIYKWMTSEESEDLNRTHYLRAIALAVIARAGGGTLKAANDELLSIPFPYLQRYSPNLNPDLLWVRKSLSERDRFPLFVTNNMVAACVSRNNTDDHGPCGVDRVQLGGIPFTKGVVFTQPGRTTNGHSYAEFPIPDEARSLSFSVGDYIDDSNCKLDSTKKPLLASVEIDGQLVWGPKPVVPTKTDTIVVPHGARKISLIGNTGDGILDCDNGVWVNVAFDN